MYCIVQSSDNTERLSFAQILCASAQSVWARARRTIILEEDTRYAVGMKAPLSIYVTTFGWETVKTATQPGTRHGNEFLPVSTTPACRDLGNETMTKNGSSPCVPMIPLRCLQNLSSGTRAGKRMRCGPSSRIAVIKNPAVMSHQH